MTGPGPRSGLPASAPPLLHQLAAELAAAPGQDPGQITLDAMGRLLREGAGAGAAAPMAVVGPVPDGLHWLRLQEAASGKDAATTAARVAAAWTALSTAGADVLLVVGADADGVPGVAVGLPAWMRGQWLADHAPDLLWQDGWPAGWSVLQSGTSPEAALSPRPGPRDTTGLPDADGGIPGLTRLLSLPVPDWCVVLRLAPVPHADVLSAQRAVVGVEQQLGRKLTTSTAVSSTSSASTEDPQVRAMLTTLAAWDGQFRDCAAEGGWACSAHAAAGSASTLAVVVAAVRSLLGSSAAGTRDRAVQFWDVQEVAPTGHRPGWGWLSSADLGALLVPPSEALGSVQVRRPLPAGRRQPTLTRPLWLGEWLGTSVPAGIDVDDLAGHAFVAGITGSGKSTTTGRLLVQLWNDHDVPFLVIDPAKADYQTVAPHLRGGLRVVSGEDLAMNVLAAWPGRPVRRHIAHVSSAFRGAFGMPVPVPYVAAMLFEQVAGDDGGSATLHDAAARLDSLVAELGYHGEIEDNIRASLGLRLRLLLQPHRADRVAGIGPPTWLVERPTLVQLGDLGDDEERAFLASMLVLWIADAARARGESGSVRHVTVIEEAHRLVPEPRGTSSEEGDAGAVAARLMTQLLAEIRGYGESVLVVDQSPAAVAREVLRNTSTKLAHRVVDVDDQRSLGGALGLAEDEQAVLGSLTPGRCLVSTRSLLRPQAVAVQRLAVAPQHATSFVPLPEQAAARCHQPADAGRHHASERHGRRAELLVGLWAADGGKTDLLEVLQPLLREDPATRPSCVMAVGIRRAAAGLRRIGHLAPEDTAAYEQALYDAALGRRDVPEHPGTGRPGPFAACSECPSPCRARAVVSAGVLPHGGRLRAALGRAGSAPEALAMTDAAASTASDELAAVVSSELAIAVGVCLAAQATAAEGFENAYALMLAPPESRP